MAEINFDNFDWDNHHWPEADEYNQKISKLEKTIREIRERDLEPVFAAFFKKWFEANPRVYSVKLGYVMESDDEGGCDPYSRVTVDMGDNEDRSYSREGYNRNRYQVHESTKLEENLNELFSNYTEDIYQADELTFVNENHKVDENE